jgi:hypothetical protein
MSYATFEESEAAEMALHHRAGELTAIESLFEQCWTVAMVKTNKPKWETDELKQIHDRVKDADVLRQGEPWKPCWLWSNSHEINLNGEPAELKARPVASRPTVVRPPSPLSPEQEAFMRRNAL